MSGIAATLENSNHIIEKMLDRIRHRGREEEEIYRQGSVQLGEVSFDREQLGAVSQKGYGLVLDGVLFFKNKRLTKTQLLNMYLEKGAKFVKDLEGKFAIIISNGDDFFVARDLFGIKPLYFSNSANQWSFASEMKALVHSSDQINIFPPGYYFTKEEGLQQFQEIPSFKHESNLSIEEAEEQLRELLYAAVKRALETSGEAAIFLSGGVDSSIIVAAAQHISGNKIPTYVAGIEGSPDLENARKVAEYFKTKHKQLVYSNKDILEVLWEIIYYLESFDVELINSSIANYFVSKLAQSDDIKVILSGEGADELFAGYHFLKQYKDENNFSFKLHELLKGLHNGGFQRVDRMAKAHSLEVEMPFMDPQVVKLALQLPARWKISENEMGKWLLRKAFCCVVPEKIIWRRKAQFGVGTGTEKTMHKIIDDIVSEEEFNHACQNESEINFKSKEEYYYYKIFKKYFPGRAALKTVNRWLV